MQELEGTAGVGGQKDILPIKNLSNETAPSVEARMLMLRALQQALYAAMDYLRECGDVKTSSVDTEVICCLADTPLSRSCACFIVACKGQLDQPHQSTLAPPSLKLMLACDAVIVIESEPD